MKKILGLITLFIFVLTGCGQSDDELTVYFVPSRDPEEIVSQTKPLEGLLKEELAKAGYDFNKVSIEVGTSYEAVGEAMASGTADVGFIPGGTYVMYEEDGVEPVLTATRAGLSKDFDNPKEWNDGKPTEQDSDNQVTFYRSLIVAGPSEKGQELQEKVNSGADLSFDDVKDANWCVRSTSSSSGYIYPEIWMNENFNKSLTDLKTAVETTSYDDSLARLANEQCDIATEYADARIDVADDWANKYNREKSIWEETGVIGVTEPIFNDTVSVANNSDVIKNNDGLSDAIAEAMINIAKTDEGKEIISVYSHEGYEKADPKNYDGERKAQKIVKEQGLE